MKKSLQAKAGSMLRRRGFPQSGRLPAKWEPGAQIAVGEAKKVVNKKLRKAVRSEAAGHEQILADFYETFKDILAQGWTLLNNRDVEAAVIFVEAHYIKEED